MINAFGMARLGRDAELRYTPNGDAVCNLSLAFSYGKKDDSGRRAHPMGGCHPMGAAR